MYVLSSCWASDKWRKNQAIADNFAKLADF